MSAPSYRPLGGYSPSLQPSLEPESLAETDHLNLDEDEYGRISTQSRPATPQPAAMYNTDYNSFRYGGAYNDPQTDIEAEGLIKEADRFPPTYRLYKRRWFGLALLTIQSLAIGWGFNAPSAVAETATMWYGVSFETLNNLSIIGNLVFLAPAPLIIWVLNKFGPKWSMVISAFGTVLGNWIIFAGAKEKNFSVNIAGTVIHAMASAFALCAPTRYSRQWFGDNGRTLATAIPSLAYLCGSGLGAVTSVYMVKPLGPWDYDTQALVIAIIFTAVAIPTPFLPSKPPTPPSEVAARQGEITIRESILSLLKNKIFYLQFITFSILAGAIDAGCNVTIQATVPYGYTQQDGANAIAILIFVGIGASLIVSPILDRTKQHDNAVRIFSVIIAAAYTGLPWVPESRSVALLFVIYAIIGAASISLEPAVLENQASVIHPVSPEFAAVITTSGFKITSAVFVLLVGKVLVSDKPEEGQPPSSLFNGLLLIAGLSWLVVGCAMLNGRWIFKRTEESKVKGNE